MKGRGGGWREERGFRGGEGGRVCTKWKGRGMEGEGRWDWVRVGDGGEESRGNDG